LLGVALIVSALSIATLWKARVSAVFLGTLLLLSFLFLHLIHASSILHNGTDRTRAFEGLTLSAIAFALAAVLPPKVDFFGPPSLLRKSLTLGRLLFALSMIVFGAQHFMYAGFIATLIPAWIPAHLFWVYLTGAGFIVAALSIATGLFASLASIGLAVMFLLWFVLLHLPRVFANPRNGDEWTSAFVAFALSGGSFLLAATFAPSTKEKGEPEAPALSTNQEAHITK
jgi:uncharacterized membrane protein YphA (DoxX/SURF4 family)